ncbi:hypothetical protein POJ06DRAFT_246421 [Lipomyces tetrasporus]|uniref:Uncharacterized protein n=1 Tax=Lipomyces tetrasporus TaxID=54092 RepID=A0AAD7QXE5_9ASCO|nr:uncharacterized protein POJ06DRAFT_246421 [Lipomyces tetrasporus]KAJ8103053.1 hypothetical protein POJ06DRAFT_246421 [Lipomyces tetrasporus]
MARPRRIVAGILYSKSFPSFCSCCFFLFCPVRSSLFYTENIYSGLLTLYVRYRMTSVAYSPPHPPRKSPLRGARPYPHATGPRLLKPPLLAQTKAYVPYVASSTPLYTPQKKKCPQITHVKGSPVLVPFTANCRNRERQIHRDNVHHQHIFDDYSNCSPIVWPQSEKMARSSAVPLFPVTTMTRKPRVSSLPTLLLRPHVTLNDSKAADMRPVSVTTPVLPAKRRRKKRVSSVPLPPAPSSPKFPPAPSPHTERLTSPPPTRSMGSSAPVLSSTVIDLAFAQPPEAPMPKLWKKTLMKVIGIEGVREHSEVLPETEDGNLKSVALSPMVLLGSRLKIKRRKKYNLNDVIYGSIGKEITLAEDEAEALGQRPVRQAVEDYEKAQACIDAGQPLRVASMPLGMSSTAVAIRPRRVVDGTLDHHGNGNALNFVRQSSVRSWRANGRRSASLATSTIRPSLARETGDTGNLLDWPDLPPVAPLNIRRKSNNRSSITGMNLVDLQGLLVPRTSRASTRSNAEFPNPAVLRGDVRSRPLAETVGKLQNRERTNILSRALICSTMAAIRKDRSRRVLLRRTRWQSAARKFAFWHDLGSGALATSSTTSIGASAASADNEDAERISESFLKFTKRAPALHYLAIPVEFARFVTTLVLFPPRACERLCPADVLARKESLRLKVMDATVVGELICLAWFVFQTCAILHRAFTMVGILCYPVVALLGMISRGF